MSKTIRPLWSTASNYTVESKGAPIRSGGRWRVPCYRVPTGGFHGDLVVARLRPINDKAVRMAARVAKAEARR